jgi:site-specific recombinase XerD
MATLPKVLINRADYQIGGGVALRLRTQDPHMLRHSTGFKLANDGHDTRSLAHYLGHRNLQSTARYTALAPDRFAPFWQD